MLEPQFAVGAENQRRLFTEALEGLHVAIDLNSGRHVAKRGVFEPKIAIGPEHKNLVRTGNLKTGRRVGTSHAEGRHAYQHRSEHCTGRQKNAPQARHCLLGNR